MGKHRLGVVLLVPEPWKLEIDGIRRALGDEALARIPTHLTLVPPITVREEDLPAAFDVLHQAAAACPALDLTLGPVVTFAPVTPVAYLKVGAEPVAMSRLIGLKDALHAGPLDRPEDWPFVPHVTVGEMDQPRIDAALLALADYEVTAKFGRVHVLAEQDAHIWTPVADAALGGP